ncbi:serine/threonine-protein kinase [bacterium]|nr:serine/threonine-protein kinase [bacterium]
MKEPLSVPVGKKLGAYEIVEHLGSGGMGAVYRARDPKFRRDVAIKVLPADFAKDPDRLQRFEQEAQAIGILNHPNILSVYDTGMADGSPYLVSEYVEGETLREKLASGALTQRKAVDYALQLARGLSAAHDKGIVHRDLKPENLMITKDGRLKILDFGLAKLIQNDASIGPLTQLPTSPGTQPGLVLGTVGYMSPEQVRGKIADHRSDIFAFGSILYEMLTGVRAFRGETPADTLSAILQKDPSDISDTNRNISPVLSRIVNHCLEKDPEQRFHSAADIAFHLESLSGASEQTAVAAIPAPRPKLPVQIWKILAVAAMAVLIVVAFLYYQTSTQPQSMLQLSIDLPAGNNFGTTEQGGELSISPDGKYVAFCALNSTDRKWHLWIRPMDVSSPQMIPGTEKALAPFWSPDSQYVAVFADKKLKKINRGGGPAQTICDAPDGRGGSWNQDGTIIFAPQPYGPLYKVSATGGTPTPLTKVQNEQSSHRWPFFLPDGKHFLFASQFPNGIYVASLEDPQPKQLNSEASNAMFVKPDTLLFVREGNLVAQPFDAKKFTIEGEAVPILDQRINHDVNRFYGFFSVSQGNSLVYRPLTLTITQPTLFDRAGKKIGAVSQAASYQFGGIFSPDGTQISFNRIDPESGQTDVWRYEFAGDRLSRLTVQADPNGPAIWTPDQSHIIFGKGTKLYRKQVSAATSEEVLFESSQYVGPSSCSNDGKFLLMMLQNPRGDWDIWVLPLSGERKPLKLIETPSADFLPIFSPDGKWVSFQSDASGQVQVYVTPFPDANRQLQISTEGGTFARWRMDGKELIYVNREKVMSVEVLDGSRFGHPKLLFERPQESLIHPVGIAPDGQRFLLFIPTADQNLENIRFISNWTQLLRK